MMMWVIIMGSLGALLGVAHGCAQHTAQEFVKDWGSNLFIAAGPRRREGAYSWFTGYAGLGIFLGIVVPLPNMPDGLVFVVCFLVIYGGVVAWRVGEAIALKLIARDIIEDFARKQLQKGLTEPPPSAAPAPPELVGGEVTFNPPSVVSEQASPKDEGIFAFDPAKFKQ